jgi:hypothetical protein
LGGSVRDLGYLSGVCLSVSKRGYRENGGRSATLAFADDDKR